MFTGRVESMRLVHSLAVALVTVLVISACDGKPGSTGSPSHEDSNLPGAPTGLRALAGAGQVSLTWNAAEAVTSYRVLRASVSGGPYAQVASPVEASHIDSGLSNGTRYYYIVHAVNGAGESPPSGEVHATPDAATAPPDAPTTLKVTSTDSQVTFTWSASAGATSYEVHRDSGCGGAFSLISSQEGTTYVDTGLTNGTSYCYMVKARNAAGTGPASVVMRATPEGPPSAPPAPTNLSATPGDGQVVLAWNASAGATSYEVRRGTDCYGVYTLIASPAGTTYTDTGLTNDVSYCYMVKARNAAGTGPSSLPASATPQGPPSAPPAPTNLTAFPGNAQVFLRWSASPRATRYTVTASPGGATVDVFSTSATLTGLTNGTTYTFSVVARNDVGDSPVATTVATLRPAVAVAAGQLHSLALMQRGEVRVWGSNSDGQGTRPSHVASGVKAVAGGGAHNLALYEDGTLTAWGYDAYGQATVPAGLSGVVAVAAGQWHSLALKQDGTVAVWGNNRDGQTEMPATLSGVVAIAAGDYHSLALKQDGTVVGWGSNYWNQVSVPSGLSGVVAVAAGGSHSLALKKNGTVVGWGNSWPVPAGLSGVVAIAAGGVHDLALKLDGTVVAWGNNDAGQSTVPAGLSGVVAVAAGSYHSLALKEDGTIVAWGANSFGQSTVPADFQ